MAMMISKFHKIIQSKVVWTAFAVLISVAFVGIYTGQKASYTQQRDDTRSEVAGKLFGEEISRQEFGRAYQNVYVMYCMMMGRSLNITEEINTAIEQAAWQRLATLKKAMQMDLTATPDQIRDMIQRQPLFQNQQTGGFDRNAYNAFVSGFLPRTGLSAKGFENMMAENVLLNKASSMASRGALVTDEEIRKAFHLYSDKLTVEYAAVPRRLTGKPKVGDTEAKAYYDRHPDQFRLPEKVIVRYVQFPVADYTKDVTVTDEMISTFYENNKQRYLKPATEDTPEDAVPEYMPLEEVKDTIAELYTLELARQQAFNAADQVVAKLSEEGTTFKQVAEDSGLKIVSNTPAFAATDSVRGVDASAPFARAAFNLEKDETHYYSDPVVGRDFVYVISLEKKLPSFLPAFDIVKAEALESARMAAAETAYVEKASEIHAAVEAAIKDGRSFAKAVSKYKMDVSTTVPFDISTTLEDEFGREIMSATIRYDAGQLVDLIPTTDEFLLAYVASKEPGDEASALPALRNSLTESIRNEKSSRLVSAWQESLLVEAGFENLTASALGDES